VGPEWITRQGVDAAEPVCHQTLEVFCGLLGAAAGNLAVTAYALGGVYLGGGILPGMVEFVRSSPLRRRFEERGPMTERVRRIPLYLVRDGTPGLVGALACLLDRHIDAA
jgi:glucokinase